MSGTMKGQKTGVDVRGPLYLQHCSWVMNTSNLLLLAISGNKILLLGTPELILDPEAGSKATYNYVLKVATNLFDWFGKELEQEKLSVLTALVDYRAANCTCFSPSRSDSCFWRFEMSQLPSLFACYINHLKKQGEKDQRRWYDPFGQL